MNILVISYETWCDTTNGGNVLSNIFADFKDDNFAQIYCSSGLPQNRLCSRYYQISDKMLMTRSGRSFETDGTAQQESVPAQDALFTKTKNSPLHEFFRLGREIMWKVFPWKTKELSKFITGFKPDVIFAPCYYYAHTSWLAQYAYKLTGCPIISYISDDNYSMRKISFSPSFWINKLITRKAIRNLFSKCSLIYTMTDAQKREYEEIFCKPMKILCKSASFEDVQSNPPHKPIRLLYGGGLYLKRWKILLEIKKALEKINSGEKKAYLDIFTAQNPPQKYVNALNDGKNSFIRPAVSYERLMQEYHASDIAVHVESFDRKNFLLTRLSFSTKIIDCLRSGCAVFAIGPRGQAGIDYLEDNDAAVCVRDKEDIFTALCGLIDNTQMISDYSRRAIELGRRNHSASEIAAGIKKDFEQIIKGQNANL